MYYISLGFAVSLAIWVIAVSLIRKRKPVELIDCIKRSPWQLIPFVLSMFVMILSLSENGVTDKIDEIISKGDEVFSFGLTSFASANIINNIPMSVLFSSIAEPLSGADKTRAIYASVVGSNLGAFLTPVGALAGIMWSSILKFQNVRFGFRDFVKYGAAVSLPTVLATLTVLDIVL
jgi:arsenical pump membrane protein